jgi:hypothetical protein
MKHTNPLACLFILIFIISGIATPPAAQAQAMVDSGVNVDEILAEARLRNFNDTIEGAYLGVPDISRVEDDIQWHQYNDLTWRLDSAENRLVLTIENDHGQWTLNYDDWRDAVAQIGDGQYLQSDLNVLQLDIWNRDVNAEALISLWDIELNGQPMGSFSAEAWLSPPRERRFITGECFGTAAGFELTATLELDDVVRNSGELNRVILTGGVDSSQGLNCGQPADVHINVDPSEVTLLRGQEVVVGVTLSNHGEGPARDTAVELLESAQLTMTDALAACSSDEPGMTICPIGDISPDGEFYFELTIRADEDAAYGQHSFGFAYSTSSQNLNPVQGDSVIITVIPQSDSLFSDRFEQVPAQ